MSPRPRSKIESLDPYADEILKLAAEGLAGARIASAIPVDSDGPMIDRWRRKNGVVKTKTQAGFLHSWKSGLSPIPMS